MALGSAKAKNLALDSCYGSTHGAAWPDTVYLHLYGESPLIGGRELTYGVGGYEPVTIANDNTAWTPATNGRKTNRVTFQFAQSTGPWSGPATYWWLSVTEKSLTVPNIPTLAVVGTPGATLYEYVITAQNSIGQTQASGIAVTFTGNSVLSSVNYNQLTWAAVATATGYNIYRLSDDTFRWIAETSGTTYSDQGAVTKTTTPPVSNETMVLLDGGALTRTVLVTAAGFSPRFGPGSLTILHT